MEQQKNSTPSIQVGDRITTGLRIQRDLYERFRRRLPKRGSRTKVINLMIEKFLDGDIIITSKL